MKKTIDEPPDEGVIAVDYEFDYVPSPEWPEFFYCYITINGYFVGRIGLWSDARVSEVARAFAWLSTCQQGRA